GLLHLSTFPPDARNVAAAKLNINSGQCCSLASFLTHDSFQANSCDLSLAGIAPQKLTFACRQQDQICCLFGNDGSVLLQWRCVGLPKNTPLNCFVALHSPSAPLSNLAPAPSNGFRRPVRVTQARLHQGVGLARVLPCLDLCGGFWDRLPQTCQHTVLACLCALNDLVTFLQTHRAACAFLIDASQHNALVASVSPCCCTRLCLNKCIEALLSQGFPIHKKFLLGCFNPRSFPPLHRTWQTFHSVDFRHVVRMASRISPSVSTAVIELSPVLLGQSQLYLTIGMSTGPHPAAVAWPHLFSLQAPFSQRGLQLEIRDGRCNGARWCTEVERMQMHALRPIDFSRCQTFTFVCSPASVALFDSRGDLVSLCPQPWPATESNELKGFIGLRGAAPLPRPDRDTTIIQPVLTQARREALQLQPLLRIVGPHVLHIGPLTLTGGGKASGSKAGSRRPTDPRSTKAHRQDVAMPKRALIIKRKWAELILSGEKTWEVRGEPTTKRGRIAIAQAGSKQLVGEVTLAECFLIGEQPSPGIWVSTGPPSQYIWAPDNANKHCITDQSSVNYKKAYAWVMEHVRKYPAPRPYTHKLGCMKWVKLDGGSVAQFSAGATSAAGNPLWCDAMDSDSTGSVSVTSVPAISLSAALLRDDASDSSSDAWADASLAFLSSNCRASSFFQALQNACGLRSACLAKTCAQLALTSSAWHCFFSHPKRFSSELPFSFIQDVHSHLSCAPLLLWILPAGDLLLLSDGFCEPYEGSVVDFPTIVFNSTNAWFFPVVMTLRPIVVPALSSCPAVGYLHLLVFGLAPTLLPPTENLFHCFKTTRLECVGHLETLRDTVALSICPCILEMGQHLCGRGLSQLALVLAPAEPVDLLILDSNNCLFHVSSFHTFQRIEWGAALLRLKNPNCFLFVFIHSTKHFLQALLRVPGSTDHAEAWLGRAQPTAHAACVATVPLNLAEPTLTERLSREALTVFTPCELLTSSPDAASCTAGASGPAQMEDDSVNACIASPGNLLRGTPEDFNRAFADVYRKDPERAKLISRYILADLAPFPHEQLKNALPDVYSMTDNLTQKAGCPFEWAFLLFLPVLGTACSKARLFINEFFLVPPLLWLGLCLDSGANKSGIMTALADIVSGFEKELLQKALDEARKEAQLAEEEEDAHGAEPDEPSSKKRKTSLSKALAAIHNNKPALFSDEGSLPAIGMQMAHNGHRAIGLYDEGRFLLRALANGEGSGFNEWHDFLAKDGALGMQSRFLMFHSSPRLEKADAVLEPAVYSTGAARSRGAPVLPASLLTQFVSVLTRIENVHTANAPDFDASREFIPYFFAPDALDYFREHYDAQVLTQEQSYLQDPKLFSHAGKLKSLPWRLALLLHSWARACSAADQSGTAWSRELSREVVEPAKAIFDYLSLQSQLLAPGSNLVSTLDTHDLRELAAQRYPYLITLIETDTLPTARAEAAPANSLPDASPSFTVWWEALSPDNKLYAFVAAHWANSLAEYAESCLTVTASISSLYAADLKVLLPPDFDVPRMEQCLQLLTQYATDARPFEHSAKILNVKSQRVAAKQVLLLSYSCCSCSRSYFGPWVEGKDATGARARMLVQDNPRYFCITQNIVFATAFLDQVTDILLHCGGSFRGIVNVLRPKLHMKIRTLEKHLRDSWLQYSVCKFLTNNRTSINCFVGKNGMEPWCRGLEDQVLHQFQRRWLLQHQCSKCERGILGVDGNAKVRTKLCANTDAGVWDCRPLNAHCLTGCQSAPIPGRKYCAVHLRDADPIFGCDLILQMILSFLATTATLLSRTEAGRHKSPDIVALFPLCRRTRKALSFAVSHAKLQYPVSLLSVKRIPRSRRYAFQTKTGQAFLLSSALVPTHYQQQYGQSLLEPVSRECQSKPRVGHQVQFSASEKNDACRRQWEKSRAARRSGGVLAAVKECQIISAIKLVYTHESPTGVYFFLAELFEFLSAGRNVNLKTAKRKTRLRTLQQTMPLVFYDCACTLQRFMASKKRRRMSKVARTLSRLRLVIDKFHFRKGHSGCKPDGTRPFPKTWPQTHASSFPNINDSAAEQSFAFVRKIAVAARRMTPVRGLLFLASLLHARNVQLELMGIKKAELAAAKKRKFMARRNFQDAVETLPFRRPASQQL
ncbi:unnamed protein product, partial [Cladocopium goreaui]